MAYQTPRTDWVDSDVVTPADLNRIENNTIELKKAATIDIVDSGNKINATNVEDALQEIATDVQVGKNTIASAITAMGQSASGSDTFPTLAAKIRDISDDATAGTGDVISGKTFYQGGSKKTGTMPNRGAVIITPGTANQTIAQGYHNGSGYVKGDTNLIPANIVAGKSIFGVSGAAPENTRMIVGGSQIFVPFELGYTVGSGYEFTTYYGYVRLDSNDTNNSVSAVTSYMIDVTNYNKLIIVSNKESLAGNAGVGLSKTKIIAPSSITHRFALGGSPPIAHDISGISGSWYIICYINLNHNSLYDFYLIALVK